MKPSGFYNLTIAGNASAMLLTAGDYFKIMAASAAVNVKSSFGELKELIAGQGLENTPFNALTIENTSSSANTVRIFIGDENFIDGLTGTVNVNSSVSVRSNFSQEKATVTNTAANLIEAGVRDYLLIQNRSAYGRIYLNFGGTATPDNGVCIGPGEAWESPNAVPQGAVSCVGDIASNGDVVIVIGA